MLMVKNTYKNSMFCLEKYNNKTFTRKFANVGFFKIKNINYLKGRNIKTNTFT